MNIIKRGDGTRQIVQFQSIKTTGTKLPVDEERGAMKECEGSLFPITVTTMKLNRNVWEEL